MCCARGSAGSRGNLVHITIDCNIEPICHPARDQRLCATEIAKDTLGRWLDSRLRTERVDCRGLRMTARATPLAMVNVDAAGVPRYDFHGLDSVLFHPDPAMLNPLWKSIRVAPSGSSTAIHQVNSGPVVSCHSNVGVLRPVRRTSHGSEGYYEDPRAW